MTGGLAVENEALINEGMTLQIDLSGSQDGTCYTVDVAGSVPCVGGDTDCSIRVLLGDVAGASDHGDGTTNLIDAAEVKSRNAEPVVSDNIRFDVNLDGNVNLIDYAEVKQRNGNRADCQ